MNHQKERNDAIKVAQALLEQKPIYLDTETTGLEQSDEIVELAILDFDGRVLFDSLVRPKISIPAGATRVHRITDLMVKNAPTWAEVWPQIGAILAGRVTAIYNAEFDIRLMKQTAQKTSILWNPPYKASSCIMELYARYFGAWDEYHKSFTWQSLEKAAEQCKIDLPNTHRAKDDAILARAVLHRMAGEDYSQKVLFESNAIVSITASKTPEEKELESKRNRLQELEESLADRELELATVNAELAAFEKLYLSIVGIKLAELDQVEAAIAEYLARANPNEQVYQQKATEARQAANESSYANEFRSEPVKKEKFSPSEKLKNLFRETARKIHPDRPARSWIRLPFSSRM
jgi:DNA polymerase III subunit epsilon